VPAAQPAGLDPDASEPAANETAPVRQGPSEGLAQGSAPLEDVAVIDRGDVGPREIAEAVPAAEGEPAAPKPGSVRPLHRGDPAGLPGSHLLPEGSEPPVAEPEARASAQMPVPEPVPAPVPVPARAPAPPLPRPEPARAADPAPRVAEPTPAVPRAEPAPAPRASSARPPAPAFPALRVEQTTWHPLAERRVAVIEVPGSGAQSVHEGDLVAGALVERIEPSAVVFEHAGREVRRKVGIAQ
jgi:hypothetical protein